MANHYANAIDVIMSNLDYKEKVAICVDYAKRHPKAFVTAAANAGNDMAKKHVKEHDNA